MTNYYPSESVCRRVLERQKPFSDVDVCWEWPLSKTKAGYGQLGCYNRETGKHENHYAHRASYAVQNGPIPKGMYVCHACDNPGCFNPAHLFLGTAKDNAEDCVRKGRSGKDQARPVGDKHWTKDPTKLARISGKNHWTAKKPFPQESSGPNHFAAKLKAEDVREIRKSNETLAVLSERYGITQSAASSVKRGLTYKSV